MTFNQHNWSTGDTITADLLNRLEQALSGHDTNITNLLSNLGDLTQLSTTSKGNLVAALNEVKGIIPAGGSGGSGSLSYNTLTDLQNAYPNGTSQPVWVIGDNAWYYWSGTVTQTVTAPQDVNSLATSNITSSTLTLSWVDTSANSTSFDVYNGNTLIGNATSTSYNVSGLSASTSYTFKVIAKNSAGSAPGTGTGASVSATTLVTTPANVTGLTTSSVTQTSLTLSWTGSTGATSYDVYNGSTLLGNTTSATYNVTGLTAGTSYTFKVVAKNAGGISSGTTVNVTTTVAVPGDVTNLTTNNISATSLTLVWTTSSSATSYDIYNGATLLGNTASTSYQVTGLTASTAYTFKVVAKNAGGSSAGVTLNVTTLASAPNPVTNLTAGTVTSSSVPITWSYTNGSDVVANFEVAYSSNSGNSYTVASNVVNASSTSYTVSGLSASTAYIIRVVAIDSSGNRSSAVTVNATTSAPADTTPPVVTASPAAGTYTSAQTVTLSATDNSGGAVTIYYTTDGTTPTTASTVYTAPISISATTTLQYIGKDPSGNVSTPVAATYTINIDTTPPVDVTGLSIGTPTASTIPVSWTDSTSTDVQYYEVAYSTGGAYTVASGTIASNAASYTISGLASNTTYTVRVVAIDTSGNRSTGVTATGTTTVSYNLFNKNTMVVSGYYINPTGVISASGTSTYAKIPVQPNTQYSLKPIAGIITTSVSAGQRGALDYSSDGTTILSYVDMSAVGYDSTSNWIIFTTPANCNYILLTAKLSGGTDWAQTIQVEQGNTIHNYYQAYSG